MSEDNPANGRCGCWATLIALFVGIGLLALAWKFMVWAIRV
jgi:hypothetical protein